MNEHKALDIKALKSALKHRDEQVGCAGTRARGSRTVFWGGEKRFLVSVSGVGQLRSRPFCPPAWRRATALLQHRVGSSKMEVNRKPRHLAHWSNGWSLLKARDYDSSSEAGENRSAGWALTLLAGQSLGPHLIPGGAHTCSHARGAAGLFRPKLWLGLDRPRLLEAYAPLSICLHRRLSVPFARICSVCTYSY